MNDRDEDRARGAHMVTHGAGDEMPASVQALIDATRECFALPAGDSSAFADTILEALGALHGDIMRDKMEAHRLNGLAEERFEEAKRYRQGMETHGNALLKMSASALAEQQRANCAEQRLSVLRPLVGSILYDMGELPGKVALAHPAALSLCRTFMESSDAIAEAIA